MFTQFHRDFCEYIQSRLPSVTTKAEVVVDHDFGESYPLVLVFNLDPSDASLYRDHLEAFRDAHPDEHLSVRHYYDDETREHFPEMLPAQELIEMGSQRTQVEMESRKSGRYTASNFTRVWSSILCTPTSPDTDAASEIAKAA